MKPKIKEKWIAALRSGEYTQGRMVLRDSDNNFCCLGVLCNLHAKANPGFAATQTSPHEYDGQLAYPSHRVRKWAGLSDECGGVLWKMNDGEQGYKTHTFEEIANHIEKNL